MINKLKKLLDNSYSPYSHFSVSSIVKMKDGNEFFGVNVENASYGATICAERSAIVAAITAGYKKGDFSEIHVLCDSKQISSSCFLCRQLISEFFAKDAKVYFYNIDGEYVEKTVSEICPMPFSESDLK